MYEYSIWLLIFVILPVSILWIFNFDYLKNYMYVFVLSMIGAITFSYPWDLIAIKEKIWYFEKPHIFGIWFLGLPIEEWIFIIFVTLFFATIVVLLCKKYRVKK